MAVSKFTDKFKAEEWKDKLLAVKENLRDEDFSVVFRFYTEKKGPAKFVGRSDSPLRVIDEDTGKLVIYEYLDNMSEPVKYIDFCYITGKKRTDEAFKKELQEYKAHKETLLNTAEPQQGLTYNLGISTII